MITICCLTCTNEFGYEPLMIHGREFFGGMAKYCDCCVDENQRIQVEIAAQKRATKLAAEWTQICPPIYQDTDPARLTPKMRQYAEAWTSENGRGVAFVGPTGKCKTRVCYMILGRHHMEGVKVYSLTATKLAELVQNKFSNDHELRASSIETLKRIERVHMLLLDDIGQERITDRTGSEFFSIIEQRTSFKRPTLWTSNLDAGTFKQALGADRGEPTLRRLREFSEIVKP
jgi:DNA replication protein DnaC